MACELCQHCDTTVEPADAAIHEGLSYHRGCHQCFVCGEIDLRGAETFHGVIFCAECSRRIFQGCSSARQPKSVKERRRARARQRRRRRNGDRVLTMTFNTGYTDSPSSASVESKRKVHRPAVPSPPPKRTNDNGLKNKSAERGTITVVTQEMLKRAIDQQLARTTMTLPAKPRKKRKIHKQNQTKKECSDLRIAELGASVEIAHVALRNRSEMPVIIKSESHIRQLKSPALSILNQESDLSGDSNDIWKESLYSTETDLDATRWTQRTIRSILKIPLKSFKRNILDRSSLVSIESSESQANCGLKKFKTLFLKMDTEYEKHGLKKLYSTINRKGTPCKLGWLHLTKSKNKEIKRFNDSTKYDKRCKHFNTSDSYRCMREQVMRMAGPTRSELAILRGKILKAVSPNVIKKILNYSELEHYMI